MQKFAGEAFFEERTTLTLNTTAVRFIIFRVPSSRNNALEEIAHLLFTNIQLEPMKPELIVD